MCSVILYTCTVRTDRATAHVLILRKSQAVGRRWREFVLAMTTSLALGAAALGGVEAWQRVPADQEDGPGSSPGIYDGQIHSERLGWMPRPGARFRPCGALTTINPEGYRGPLVGTRPPSGRARVLLLGDSVAFGYCVADGESFADLLGQDDRLEIVNLAVPGYGIDQSLLRYELAGRRFHADVVALNVCVANDLADIMLPTFLYDGRSPKPYFLLKGNELVPRDEHLRLGGGDRSQGRFREGSAPVSQLMVWFRRLTGTERWKNRFAQATADPTRALRLMLALIDRLRAEVEADGGRLVLVVHPSRASYGGEGAWPPLVLRVASLEDLPTLDLSRSHAGAGSGFESIATDDEGHLSRRGHALVAEALRGFLTEQRSSSVRRPL